MLRRPAFRDGECMYKVKNTRIGFAVIPSPPPGPTPSTRTTNPGRPGLFCGEYKVSAQFDTEEESRHFGRGL
jgi:hypothetical protein